MKPYRRLTAAQLIKELDAFTYTQLHIHHTWRPRKRDFTGANHEALQTGMENYHRNANGWDDIAQHVTLFPDGTFLTGRPFGKTPISIKGWNTGAFAVEMIGDFDIGQEKLDGEQRKAIVELARYFRNRFGESSIRFHREGPNVTKSCPGSGISKADFLEEVRTLGKIFKDVPDDRWSAPYIEKAKKLDIIRGDGSGNFNPTAPLTREEAAAISVRLYEKITGKEVL
jgi:hypothetical protein